MQTYSLSNRVTVTRAACMPILFVRDVPADASARWESFDEHSVESYFTKGMERFVVKLSKFGDPSQEWGHEEGRELEFMFESLIHARRLLKTITPNLL